MKVRMFALLCMLVLVVAACGEEAAAPAGDATEPEPTEPEAAETEPGEPEADPEADETEADETEAAGEGAVVTVASTEFGDVLVDGEGLALYMFESDRDGVSTCYDDCAANWPPLLAGDGAAAGDGADDALLGTTERDDGTAQVTYGGHPLYYFAGDSAAGDVAGQGVADVWWLVAADGEPVTGSRESGGYGSDY